MIQEQLISPPFLDDANCLIEPYNPYYNPQFDLSAPFWQHLQDLVSKDQVAIIDKVTRYTATTARRSIPGWTK
ncbi:DUF4411 family protein [Bifidobacterium mizhiense]|uniref:DUF4411 family protein n=1 Tax=Bifidobacterium mizhiense TaxID=2879940 RepID=UPI0035711C16